MRIHALNIGEYKTIGLNDDCTANIMSEEDADIEEFCAMQAVKNTGIFCFAVFLVLIIFSVVEPNLNTTRVINPIAIGAIYMFLFATMVSSLVVELREDNDILLSFAPLSDYPNICAKLMAMVESSAAVREYVTSSTSMGRQLRKFDMANAREVLAKERRELEARQSNNACAMLHSLQKN